MTGTKNPAAHEEMAAWAASFLEAHAAPRARSRKSLGASDIASRLPPHSPDVRIGAQFASKTPLIPD